MKFMRTFDNKQENLNVTQKYLSILPVLGFNNRELLLDHISSSMNTITINKRHLIIKFITDFILDASVTNSRCFYDTSNVLMTSHNTTKLGMLTRRVVWTILNREIKKVSTDMELNDRIMAYISLYIFDAIPLTDLISIINSVIVHNPTTRGDYSVTA